MWTRSAFRVGSGCGGIEGKIGAIRRYARENGVPILGLCLGLQCMVIEVARDLAGLVEANSSEFDVELRSPWWRRWRKQKHIVDGAGDSRWHDAGSGCNPANLAEGSNRAWLYGAPSVQERHRHRY